MPASTVYTSMRLFFLLLAAIASAQPLWAQQPDSSSTRAGSSSVADTRGTTPVAQDPAAADLPVSLGRIRDGLKRPTDAGLRNLDVKPDFTVHIDEQRRIEIGRAHV